MWSQRVQHCDAATLAALIRIEGTIFLNGPGHFRLEISTDVPQVARFIISALHSILFAENRSYYAS